MLSVLLRYFRLFEAFGIAAALLGATLEYRSVSVYSQNKVQFQHFAQEASLQLEQLSDHAEFYRLILAALASTKISNETAF